MTTDLFLAQYEQWILDLRKTASEKPGTGACTLGTAMELWLWTLKHLQQAKDASGAKLYSSNRHGVTFPMADALCWLLAAHSLIQDVLELEAKGPLNPALAEGLAGTVAFYTDLCHTQAARAAGEAGRICSELVFGYQAHPSWTGESCKACYGAEEIECLEGVIPGIADSARAFGDVTEKGAVHPDKAGPCAGLQGLEAYVRLRLRLEGCLTGARLAKDRAAEALTQVMIPEALDYPM